MVVGIALPLERNRGQAVIAGNLGLQALETSVAELNTPSTFAILLTKDGNILAHPNMEHSLKAIGEVHPDITYTLLKPLIDQDQANPEVEEPIEVMIDGVATLLSAARIKRTGWILVFLMDRNVAYTSSRMILYTIASMSLFFVLLSSILLIFVIRRLLRALYATNHALGDLAAGDGT